MDWRTYVGQYPIASLGVAVVAGALVGRRIGGMVADGDHRAATPAVTAGAGFARLASSRPVNQSWSRATARLEEIVNRVIDEAGETIEQVLVPTLMNGFARLLGGDRAPMSRSLADAERRQGTPASI